MLSLFRTKERTGSPEQIFWDWFLSNKKKIEEFIDSDHTDYTVYNLLTKKMNGYSGEIIPELTKTDGKYVLIISPDGLRAGVEPTKALAAAKPDIENWIVQKFRQPCDEITLDFDGLSFPASDIEIIPRIDYEKEVIDVDVFLRNMNNDPKRYQNLAFLYLDHILGEFNSITKLGYIEFHHLDPNKKVKDSVTILQLRELIAAELY